MFKDSKIIVDIWEGDHSENHIARFVDWPKEALKIAEKELQYGYLINLRAELLWEQFNPFDNRGKPI